MITITIDGQQFEIGPGSMQVENEEVFELVANSSRVFNHLTKTGGPYVLKTVSCDCAIKNFAFCLKDSAGWQTYVYDDYVVYQKNIYTLKHTTFQLLCDLRPYYRDRYSVECTDNDNWYILDLAVANGSYLNRFDIIIHAKMISNRRSSYSTLSPPNKRYEVYSDESTYFSFFSIFRKFFEGYCDELTKFLTI